MAAFTGSPTSSGTYEDQTTAPVRKASARFIEGNLQIASMEAAYTHAAAAGAGTGEVNLLTLPAGRLRVFPDLSRLVTTQFATNADIHIGTRAFTDPVNGTVAEDDNRFENDADAGGGALDAALTLPAAGFADLDSENGITVYAMIDTGNIETDDTIWVSLAYVKIR